MKMESGLNTGVREVMREKCTDINLLLSEIEKLNYEVNNDNSTGN